MLTFRALYEVEKAFGTGNKKPLLSEFSRGHQSVDGFGEPHRPFRIILSRSKHPQQDKKRYKADQPVNYSAGFRSMKKDADNARLHEYY
jgi:hypothetical protein